MKILIGQKFNLDSDPSFALEIPGIGIVKGIEEERGFPFVELNKKMLLQLKKHIEKELEDGKENNL